MPIISIGMITHPSSHRSTTARAAGSDPRSARFPVPHRQSLLAVRALSARTGPADRRTRKPPTPAHPAGRQEGRPTVSRQANPSRSDAGVVRLTGRDITGLILAGDTCTPPPTTGSALRWGPGPTGCLPWRGTDVL